MSGPGAFSVPFSSSPPSTPGSRRNNLGGHENLYPSLAPHPSTTPAGPPPSSARSFTPAGPPPTSVFGSSQLGLESSKPLFALDSSSAKWNPEARHHQGDNSPFSRPGQKHRNVVEPFTSSRILNASAAEQNNLYDRQERRGTNETRQFRRSEEVPAGYSSGDEPDVGSEDASMDEGFQEERHAPHAPVSHAYDWTQHASPMATTSSRGIKRSRGGAAMQHNSGFQNSNQLAKRKESVFPTIAKNLAKQIGPAQLDEPDELIIETEKLVLQLYPYPSGNEDQQQRLQIALGVVPEALCKLWQSCCNDGTRASHSEYTIGIGPGEGQPALHKATFLSSLLLKLHHPPPAKGKQAYAAPSGRFQSRLSESLHRDRSIRQEAYPRVLLDWLEQHHNPYPTATKDLQSYYPNPTAHLNFWDIIYSAVISGKLSEVISILKNSDFQHARTAPEDGSREGGYHGLELQNINQAINRLVSVLESCPAVQDDDWQVTGNDWMIFRKRVQQAMSDLATFSEGHDRDMDPVESTFEAHNFGMRSTSNALSRSARQAESRVPWTVYQNLKLMYKLLLGGTAEIITFAQDWVEAAIGLAVWWDGDEDDEVAAGSLLMSRRSLRRSQGPVSRLVDLNDRAAYHRRLAYAFERVTEASEDDTFQIDSLNPVEVGLVSIFEGNIEGVVELLRAWSSPITAAVVEVATQAGWFESAPGDGAVPGFDESDLMVLSYGQPARGLSRDGVLATYAEVLFDRKEIQDTRLNVVKEGWELAIEVLDRLNDKSLATRKVGEILERLPLISDYRTDKLIRTCHSFGLHKEACEIAEVCLSHRYSYRVFKTNRCPKKYADSIAEDSDRYGNALVYYARSHNAKKVKDVLDLLISLCLVQSLAFPPKSAMDQNLKGLVNHPRESLAAITSMDPEAAELLQSLFGGYATMRKFYDLRDEEVQLKDGQKPSLRPAARKKAAASALLTVIASAADNIQGGLYDEEMKAVVQVDGLLALLGEAMVFVNSMYLPILCLPMLTYLTILLRAYPVSLPVPGTLAPWRYRRSPNRSSTHLRSMQRMLAVDLGSCARFATPTISKGNDEEKYQLLDVQ